MAEIQEDTKQEPVEITLKGAFLTEEELHHLQITLRRTHEWIRISARYSHRDHEVRHTESMCERSLGLVARAITRVREVTLTRK